MVKAEQELNRGYEKQFTYFPDVKTASLAALSSLRQRYLLLFYCARDIGKFLGGSSRKVTIRGVTYDVEKRPIDAEVFFVFYAERKSAGTDFPMEITRIALGTDREYRPPKKIEVTVDRFNDKNVKVGSIHRSVDARGGVRLEVEVSPIPGMISNPSDKRIFNLETYGPSFEANLIYKIKGDEHPVLTVTPTAEVLHRNGSDIRTDLQTGQRQLTLFGRTIFIPPPAEFVSQGIVAVADLR